MNDFIARYSQQISGVLSGFDRLVLRGNLTGLNHEVGMKGYLWASGVAWKDYAQHVEKVSQRLKKASLDSIAAQGRFFIRAQWKQHHMERDVIIFPVRGVTVSPPVGSMKMNLHITRNFVSFDKQFRCPKIRTAQ